MVQQLKTACCGCSLKTGTIIIAVLGIFTGLSMVGKAFLKAEPESSNSDNKAAMDLLNQVQGHSKDGNEESFTVVLNVVMALVEIIMSIVLLVGAIQGRPKLVYSWVVLNVVQTALGIIVLTVIGIYLLVTGLVEIGLVVLGVTAIAAVVQAYYILIVNSFHTTLLTPPNYEYMAKEPMTA